MNLSAAAPQFEEVSNGVEKRSLLSSLTASTAAVFPALTSLLRDHFQVCITLIGSATVFWLPVKQYASQCMRLVAMVDAIVHESASVFQLQNCLMH